MYTLFLNVLEFLVSPLGLPLFFSLLFILPMTLYVKAKAKRYEVLRKHLQGTYSWRHGLRLTFKNYQFRFSEIGRAKGSVDYGSVSLQPMLWGYVEAPVEFFCASKEIEKYEFQWNLGTHAYRKSLMLGEKEIIIGADSEAFLHKLEETLIGDPDLEQAFLGLLTLPASYLSVKKEQHVGKSGLFSKEQTFRYFGFLTNVYTDPSVLESSMENIAKLFKKLGIQIERTRE